MRGGCGTQPAAGNKRGQMGSVSTRRANVVRQSVGRRSRKWALLSELSAGRRRKSRDLRGNCQLNSDSSKAASPRNDRAEARGAAPPPPPAIFQIRAEGGTKNRIDDQTSDGIKPLQRRRSQGLAPSCSSGANMLTRMHPFSMLSRNLYCYS